jgi:hypothetical protein
MLAPGGVYHSPSPVLVGLPETVWAAAVPMNYTRKLEDLVEDIYGDHLYLVSRLPAAVMKGSGDGSIFKLFEGKSQRGNGHTFGLKPSDFYGSPSPSPPSPPRAPTRYLFAHE